MVVAASPDEFGDYERRKGSAARRSRESSEQVRDIGLPPACSNLALRQSIEANLELFLQTLWPDVFKWPFSKDQQLSIRQMDSVIDRGGLQAVADPRGTGKTQRALRGALKAILTGKRKYVCIVAATEKAARKIVKALRTILCFHQELQGLFPAELWGFAHLEGNNRKAGGQLCDGQPTAISITADSIVFPTVPGSRCSGAIISCCGITGNVRGQFHTRQDGSVIRPDLVIVDDPQTKESASSPAQTQERLEIIEGDVLGLAGPDTAIACMVMCTVIEREDLSDRILRSPKWHGRRTKTIYEWPENLKAWDEYFEDYDEAIRTGKPESINVTYSARREILDIGCRLAWDHRLEAGDVSAIQTAMHIWHRVGPAAFGAEYQNEPIVDSDESSKPSAVNLPNKLIGLERATIPSWATKLTLAIDCQQTCLFFLVVAWSDDFTGHIVDYGCFPDQNRNYFILREVSPTLQMMSGSSQVEGALRWGLDQLSERLLGKPWMREDGGEMRISKCAVDAGSWPDTIHEFAARSPYGAVILPCHGIGITASKVPMERWVKRDGEQLGWHWAVRRDRRVTPHGLLDTYFWKTFFCDRLAATKGEKGSMTIFGQKPEQHRLLIDHLKAEQPIRTAGQGRELWEWKALPGQDNHWLDCLASNCAMAAMLGAHLDGATVIAPTRRKFTLPGRR